MIRLGMLDFDTSHCVAFTQRLNHNNIDEDQWVDGAQVVIGCPGTSKLSPERIPGFTKQMREMGVPLVEDPKEMIGKVDGMLIEAVDGSVHLERARPFLEAGLPCFVDKPFACSLKDAKEMVRLAEKNKVAIFSSSSLRYVPELVAFVADESHGKILGASTYGPGPTHERNPGLFHYGIHAVEVLYTLMGPGCRRVMCSHQDGVDVVTGEWDDGRVGTVRAIRKGKADYGAVAFTEKAVTPMTIGTGYIYRELLKRIVEMFRNGEPPMDPRETLELVAFIEAANKSGVNHGIAQDVA